MDSEKLKKTEVAIDGIIKLNPYYLGRIIGYIEGISEKGNINQAQPELQAACT